MTKPLTYSELISHIKNINPRQYEKTRNFLDGDVTRLSPYITHGVIGISEIAGIVLNKWSKKDTYKLIQELAWREFFHKIWREIGDDIWLGVKHDQQFQQTGIPIGLFDAKTGIVALDNAVKELYQTGYIHNHARMWIASYVCNIAKCRWQDAAQWMYYYLFDGDRASNSLSWQWVAGTLTGKPYLTNQTTINRYTRFHEKNTLLDQSYEYLADNDQSSYIQCRIWQPEFSQLPNSTWVSGMPTKNTILLYSIWTLDASWHKEIDATRILILDRKELKKYAISQSRIDWILQMAQSIQDLFMYVGDIEDLTFTANNHIIRKSHPAMNNFIGIAEPYQDLFSHPWKSGGFMNWWGRCESEYFSRHFYES